MKRASRPFEHEEHGRDARVTNMSMRDDDNFDLLLRGHLSAELDGQLGRAPAAFARSSRRRPWRAVMIGAAGLAAAAVLGIVLMRPVPPPAEVAPLTERTTSAEYQLAWQTIDRGTVYLDEDTPARSYLRRQVETLRWIDPETQQSIEVTVPRDDIVLIGLNTF